MKVLSLFTGIGGLDAGFGGDVVVRDESISPLTRDFILEKTPQKFVHLKKHDFDLVFQNDILKGARDIYLDNFKTNNYVIRSIFDLLTEGFIFPSADVVIGGFPCQDFSHAGRRMGLNSTKTHDLKSPTSASDKAPKGATRGTLYKCFIDVIQKVKPKFFVAENVYGLVTMHNGDVLKQIICDFESVGYDVGYQVVFCPDFGIPQTRRRVIILGARKDLRFSSEDLHKIVYKNKATCNVGKYFEHLSEPDVTDDPVQRVFSRAKRLSKGQGQKKIDLDGFAPTIRAEHHGNVEFRNQQRRLTVRECALIQTFSPDFVFPTNQTAYKYIGNAVPPLLSYLIADRVIELNLQIA